MEECCRGLARECGSGSGPGCNEVVGRGLKKKPGILEGPTTEGIGLSKEDGLLGDDE